MENFGAGDLKLWHNRFWILQFGDVWVQQYKTTNLQGLYISTHANIKGPMFIAIHIVSDSFALVFQGSLDLCLEVLLCSQRIDWSY